MGSLPQENSSIPRAASAAENTHENNASSSILNSWKEIAQYLGRGVRTVQRWEQNYGLPVHRPKGRDRSATLALAAELDEWLRATPVRSRLNGHTGDAPLQNSPKGNG